MSRFGTLVGASRRTPSHLLPDRLSPLPGRGGWRATFPPARTSSPPRSCPVPAAPQPGRRGAVLEDVAYGCPANSASVGTVRGPLSSQTAYLFGYIETPACSPRAFRT